MCLDRGGDAEAASQATPEPSNLLVPPMNITSVRERMFERKRRCADHNIFITIDYNAYPGST